MERKIAQLVTKVISNFEHHVCTSCGITANYYAGAREVLVGSGQGNA